MSDFNPYLIRQILERSEWRSPFVPASDRAWWEDRSRRIEPAMREEIVATAERALEEPPAWLPASLYLAFCETGDRKQYEALLHQRGRNLGALALAECFQGEGRYLTRLQDYIWTICEQATWSYPAHHPELPDPERPHIDLAAAMNALALADISLLLGDRFEPGLARTLRHELETRIWQPYLERDDYWWQWPRLDRELNNWTAVCTAGVVGSAIAMQVEPECLGRMIDKALRAFDAYLATFDPDGGSSEGPGYWDYGFGYFTIGARMIADRTEGAIDLLARPEVREIAQFPLRTRLSPGHYVPFSDCSLDVQMEPGLLEILAQRLDLPTLRGLAPDRSLPSQGVRGLNWMVRDLHWRSFEPPVAVEDPAHVWFRGLNWMISRDAASGLVLAIKGGHNAEMHNQNDVGSMVVHIDGETLIADIGRGRYTRQYFGPERYTYLVNSSRGHSVPVVNETEQATGAEAAATVIAHEHGEDRDRLALDLYAAYPASSGLHSLVREVIFDRTAKSVSLADTYAFRDGPAPFESVLITLANVEQGPGSVLIQGARHALDIAYDPATVRFALDEVPDIDLVSAVRTVRRLRFMPAAEAANGAIALTIRMRT